MQSEIFSPQWCDLIFEGRNQNYGAFLLRKISSRNSLIAFLLAVGIILIGSGTPYLLQLLNKKGSIPKLITFDPFTPMDPPPFDSKPPVPDSPSPKTPNKKLLTSFKIADSTDRVDTVPPQDLVNNFNPGPTANNSDENSAGTLTVNETQPADPEPDNDGKPFKSVQNMPEFPGGEKAMLEFIQENLHYPRLAIENRISGKVYVTFYIDKYGKVQEVIARNSIGGRCDEEAVRVLKLMPVWTPGRQNGRAVNVEMTLPVKFKLNND